MVQEDFEAAGIDYQDLSNLNESQLQMLLDSHKRRTQKEVPDSSNQQTANFENVTKAFEGLRIFL